MSVSHFNLFLGRGVEQRREAALPPLADDSIRTDPSAYVSSDAIRHAVNAAVALGKPLLVTGEAGTGKTQLASRVAWELTPQYAKPLRFQVRSRSEGMELFYRYDSLRHFQDAQTQKAKEARDYIRIEALGEAILRANPGQAHAREYTTRAPLPDAPMRSVVLIDEIDKAPRDLPNDILAEVEEMKFTIAETGHEFQAEASHFPVVILTSNSERDLPDAFLRRCVYLHIDPPNEATLLAIIKARVKPLSHFSEDALHDVIQRYEEIRSQVKRKKPATDELLSWVKMLDHLRVNPKRVEAGQKEALALSYAVLLKDKEDLERIRKGE